ncbi:DoxX family protein [Mycobacterium sp.]|uniref:DoxX family protein n=1 Tax=Mycobacterium sp. TaxID=1785 RepID=UPI002B7B2BE3|nr:DoxX family protein [Mycobacterium sp.]HME49064.1 DoxX family protein [Mycobacterium sp.]
MTTRNLQTSLNSYSPTVLSVFRIVIGFLFMVHGLSIVFGWPLAQKLPIGTWPGWWAGLIEFVTGLLVLVGLFTRPAAFLASGTMAVAYFWMHQPKALWPMENGGEPAVLFCFAFLLLVFLGPGAYAIETRRPRGSGIRRSARR